MQARETHGVAKSNSEILVKAFCGNSHTNYFSQDTSSFKGPANNNPKPKTQALEEGEAQVLESLWKESWKATVADCFFLIPPPSAWAYGNA